MRRLLAHVLVVLTTTGSIYLTVRYPWAVYLTAFSALVLTVAAMAAGWVVMRIYLPIVGWVHKCIGGSDGQL